ncbi:MAG: MFS transporter [Gammaproteobacteria bacterium]|nr:MFS transporter [Gammaproteobacteria bacterium]MDH5260618.1 MFS transporter [Gammaproteobacteria bacterium]MDH5582708.1 MFS transporter [Gammaproteobacteria bacterium]
MFAIIVSMIIVNLVYGVTLPLLSLVLDSQGISKTVIGLSIVAQASAGVLLAPFIPRLIIRAGAARVMQGAALLAAGTLVVLGLFQDVYLWFPLRFLMGAAASMLWSASESVINGLAAENWRGRIIGIYGSAGAAGFALGPLVLLVTGTDGLLPFVVTAGFVIAASLPLFWLADDARANRGEAHVSLARIFRLVPHIMLLNFTYAAAVESFIAFFPLFGIHIGLGEARSLSLLTTFALGGVFLQLPLGWLADHMPRQRLLLTCILLTIVGFVIFPEVIDKRLGGPIFAFTLGGIEGVIYALGMVLLGQRFRGTELAAASVLYTGMWGAGTMLGPTIIGASMDILGDQSMPYLIALIYVIYLPVFFISRRHSLVAQETNQ